MRNRLHWVIRGLNDLQYSNRLTSEERDVVHETIRLLAEQSEALADAHACLTGGDKTPRGFVPDVAGAIVVLRTALDYTLGQHVGTGLHGAECSGRPTPGS